MNFAKIPTRFLPHFLLIFSVLLIISCKSKVQDLTQHVNPFIGTGGHGHTFPGATLPFGMLQLSPDTRMSGWDGCGGYHYSDSVIIGFSHTHLSGTGVSDYGDILLMPTVGEIQLENGANDPKEGYASHFSHEKEEAHPGYYRVRLLDYNVRAELTATTRAGFHRYTFLDESEENNLILDLTHRDKVIFSGLKVVSETQIEGFRISEEWAKEQYIYFVAEFSQPFTRKMVTLDGKEASGQSQWEGSAIKAGFSFPWSREVMVKVGISAVSIEGARENLKHEIKGWDFDQIRGKAEKAWQDELQKTEVKGGSEAQLRTFYTALYHTMIAPNTWSDVDGNYRGMDGKIHAGQKGRTRYTVFSLWDTFRATHPLYTLNQQERTRDFLYTFKGQYQEGGILPIWELAGNYTGCMIGYHAIPVIADAWLKGLEIEGMDTLYEAMKHSARQQHLGLRAYQEQGYIPAGEEAESVSKTLEYAFDDWCIAQIALKLGREDEYKEFITRSQYWKNVYDPETGFMRAKLNETWFSPFDPYEVNFNYTEANAWQYRFFVPHDLNSLIEIMGGPARFEAALDSMFEANAQTSGREQADITGLIGQYAHGNEPSHHMAYLYNFIGKTWKTQQRVRQIMDELYSDQPDGLSGNEDCGQMSAWLVMSAMGLYPVNPASGKYELGTPWFDEVKLNLENGKVFIINRKGGTDISGFVKSASLNGEPLQRSWVSHSDLLKGGELEFEMEDSPSQSWAVSPEGLPTEQVKEEQIIPVPYFKALNRTFTDQLEVEIKTAQPGLEIHFSVDGSEPDLNSPLYSNPLKLTQSTDIKARAFASNGKSSHLVEAHFYKIPAGRSIKLNSQYANQYSAGGDYALIDYQMGGVNFRTGSWQGYREDLSVTVSLGKKQPVHKVEVGFLQDIGAWIWMPSEVKISVSIDGNSYREIWKGGTAVPDNQYGGLVKRVGVSGLNLEAAFVKVEAKNYGECPAWHLGAGGKTWIFADEIVVE
ncbi:MAG: glycoside hydrolase family 92 protein [Bacteroidia bacterium]|nr:glycoside hydrolase family 92 protein [Bacteroidia bacterium]